MHPDSSKSLASYWRDYLRDNISFTMPQSQYDEIKAAYYAGAATLLILLASGPDNRIDHELYIASLQGELRSFAESIARGIGQHADTAEAEHGG